MEEGLHRLYEATVEHQCFPGDVPEAGDDEVSTKEILEALQLSVPSRDETANPSLPCASGSRRHSLSPSTQSSCGQPLQQPSPASTTSDLSCRHPATTSPTKTLHVKTRHSSVSAPEVEPYWSCPSIDSVQNTTSPASDESQDVISFKAVSSYPSPVTEVDMCSQFIVATNHPNPTTTQYPSLPSTTFPPYTASEDMFFDFDRYNQEAAISLLVSQEQTQDCALSNMSDPCSGLQLNPGFDLAHSDQMPVYPAYPSTQVVANTVNSGRLKDSTDTEKFAFSV